MISFCKSKKLNIKQRITKLIPPLESISSILLIEILKVTEVLGSLGVITTSDRLGSCTITIGSVPMTLLLIDDKKYTYYVIYICTSYITIRASPIIRTSANSIEACTLI